MIVPQTCLTCQVEFSADSREVNRGNAKYCSKSCFAKRPRLKPEPNVKCAFCNTKFYIKQSRIKLSKSGLFFCCREHKDAAQKIGGIKDIMPPHYGTTLSDYRQIAKRNLDVSKCSKCGYDKHPGILEINHKDCNRSNNSIDNLEALCPNCHAEFHYLTKTGPWKYSIQQ